MPGTAEFCVPLELTNSAEDRLSPSGASRCKRLESPARLDSISVTYVYQVVSTDPDSVVEGYAQRLATASIKAEAGYRVLPSISDGEGSSGADGMLRITRCGGSSVDVEALDRATGVGLGQGVVQQYEVSPGSEMYLMRFLNQHQMAISSASARQGRVANIQKLVEQLAFALESIVNERDWLREELRLKEAEIERLEHSLLPYVRSLLGDIARSPEPKSQGRIFRGIATIVMTLFGGVVAGEYVEDHEPMEHVERVISLTAQIASAFDSADEGQDTLDAN